METRTEVRWTTGAAWALLLGNLAAIVAAALSGQARGDLAFRFEEKQAITILSATQLGATALLGWLVYVVRDRLPIGNPGGRHQFWLISSLGFLYLMLDESFQFHEGMDTTVARWLGWGGDPLLDGVPTLIYGFAAAAVCYRFRGEILRFSASLGWFGAGGVFLAATSLLNLGDTGPAKIVVEESTKLLGVACFLLAHLAAFGATVERLRVRTAYPRVSLAPPA